MQRTLALAALLLAAGAGPALAQGAADRAPWDGRVVVYRGGDATPSAVPVHRGSAAPPAYLVAAPPAARRMGTVGGDRLWFVDPEGDRLTGCRLVRTADVGRQAIHCAARRLPLD